MCIAGGQSIRGTITLYAPPCAAARRQLAPMWRHTISHVHLNVLQAKLATDQIIHRNVSEVAADGFILIETRILLPGLRFRRAGTALK